MIHMAIPWLPPSLNNAYITIKLPKGSKRTLSKEGRRFKAETIAHLTENYAFQLKGFVPNKPYTVLFVFTQPDLLNSTWPKTAKARYKRSDTTNLFKIAEDALAEVLAVDDSHYLTVVGKRVTGLAEHTDIWIWRTDEERSPLDDAIEAIRSR